MKYATVIAVLLATTLVYAQSGPTPASQLRVLVDANNYLLATSAAQTLPISNPTPFGQIRLRTDANNNLIVVCPTCGSGGTGDVVGPASAISGNLAYFNSGTGKSITNDTGLFWDPTAQKLNVLGGVTGNNGPLLVTRKATGGSPVLASAASFYRNSQYSGGTPAVNDILNAEFLLQGSDNLWYTVGGVGGKITNIGAPAGGPIFHCKPTAAFGVDNVIPCMFLSSTGKLRIGDGNEATSILEIKDTTTNFVLSAPTLSQAETVGVRNQVSAFATGNPTGTTSLTDVMMGLGSTLTFTPKQTGRVRVTLNFIGQNSLSGDGIFVTLYRGTGTAPTNGTAVTGTQTGGGKTITAIANNQQVTFVLDAVPSGLTLNTAYWFDVAVHSVTGGTSTISSVSSVFVEM